MPVIEPWNGRHAMALRHATRMTYEAFAEHLGAAVSTVKYWNSHPAAVVRQVHQDALDTVLESSSDSVRERFAHLTAGTDRAGELWSNSEIGMLEGQAPSLEVARIDRRLVELLEAQTQGYRQMDRAAGAALIPQTVAHVDYVNALLRNALPGRYLPRTAVALAEAAALAGWQVLDTGDPARAWTFHDLAKSAAAQGDNPSVAAYVTAEQAYALLDAGQVDEAVELVQFVNVPGTTTKLPPRLRAWLAAAEAEFLSAAGQEASALRMLQQADDYLPAGDSDPELPYLMLNRDHLGRWRGHCLARLGAEEAVDDITAALNGAAASKRAETGLRADLAIALRSRGEVTAAKDEAQRALTLAGSTGSVRQRRRIQALLR